MTRLLGTLGMTRTEGQAVTLWDAERLKYVRGAWDYHRRALHTNFDRTAWKSNWPSSRGLSGDGSTGYSIRDDFCCGGEQQCWSLWIEGYAGHGSSKYIIGQVQDSLGASVSGAIVQGFRTSDDLYIGQCTADSNGRYVFETPYASPTAHYLVAYRDGSPDIAGTTVDTLTSTNMDGT